MTRKKHRDNRMNHASDERLISAEIVEAPAAETVAEVEGETVAVVEGQVFPVVPGAKPRVYCPPPCSACTALRPAGTNYTRTNGTETRVNTPVELIIKRSCKCHFCGHTWPDYEIIKHKNKATSVATE